MTKWPMVRLRDVLLPVSRPESVDATTTYRMLGARWYALGLYLKDSLTGAEIQAPKVYRVIKGDFVYNRLFAWKGSFAVAGAGADGCFVSNEFPCFEVNQKRLIPSFLWWYFSRESAWNEALSLSTGGTPTSRNRLKESAFLHLLIPIPPLQEQQRLVEHLDALSAKIDEAKRLREEANTESGQLVRASLDEVFGQASKSGSWPRVPLRDAATIARGKFTHRPRNEPRFYGGTIPFIQIGDISASRLVIQNYSQTLNEQGLQISRMFPRGTVVIAITGATIGVTRILGFDSCFPDSIVGIQPKDGISTSEFIYWAVEYEKHKALSQATQTTQPNINLTNLDSLTVFLPALAEQATLVERITEIDARAEMLRKQQADIGQELDAMLPAILEQAFNGQVQGENA